MNYKHIAAVSVLLLTLSTCSSPANGVTVKKHNVPTHSQFGIKSIILIDNTKKIEKAISKLKTYVGKTWYAFSGNTHAGWDCSGLTMWTYEQIGITLEHRASLQAKAGIGVKDPKIGDIVVFTYNGSNSAYHVGIYIGNGKMIHAPNKGEVTRIENISKFAGKSSKVDYRRIIESA
jgi:cell wall-associated NlpC family hydrolase